MKAKNLGEIKTDKRKWHPFVLGLFDSVMAMNFIRNVYKLLYGDPNWSILSIISFYFMLRLHDLYLLLKNARANHVKHE